MTMSVLGRPRTGETAAVADQVLVYLRISEDRTCEEAGVERQRDDCLALCGRLGLDVAAEDVFMDNDTSAYLNKKRPEFEKLLARRPEAIVEQAIKGMLPKSKMGRQMATKLKVYKGDKHPHDAQQPQPLTVTA